MAGETEACLGKYAGVGLLHRQPDGDFDPDSLHHLMLFQFAKIRRVAEDYLAAAIAGQGDLLSIFTNWSHRRCDG